MAACPNFAAAFRSTRLLAGGLRGLAGARNHLARRTPRSRRRRSRACLLPRLRLLGAGQARPSLAASPTATPPRPAVTNTRQVMHLPAGGEEGARRNLGREVARREDGVHELLSLLDVVIGAKTAAARMLR